MTAVADVVAGRSGDGCAPCPLDCEPLLAGDALSWPADNPVFDIFI